MKRLWLIPAVMCVLSAATLSADTWTFGPYQYDGAGNVKVIGPNDSFFYDELGRLKFGTAGIGRSQSYEYDRFGNLTAITTEQQRLELGANAATNQLTDTSKAAHAQYDAAGRMTRMTAVDPGGSFVYDALSMAKESTVDGVRKIHLYSASNERVVSVTMAGGTESRSDWTLRDTSNRVLRRFERTGGAWKWKQDYIYRDGRLLASEVDTSSGRLHFHPDHLGTPRLITGNGGVEVSRHTYYPFGLEVQRQTSERLRFTGHERDFGSAPATDLDYMHARFYSPMWGRFLSVDPVLDIKRSIREPQSWNRYSYVINNPINRIDPDGRMDGNGMFEPAEWRCPGCTRAEQLEQSNQIAAGTAGLTAAFGSLFIPGPEDVAVGAFAASRAGGAVIRFFGRLLARGDRAADAAKLSRYDDVTTGRSIPNRSTNVSRADFGKNLEANGFTKSVSKDGKVTIYQKDNVKYTVRDSSKSTGGPTAEMFKDGKLVQKIRLEELK